VNIKPNAFIAYCSRCKTLFKGVRGGSYVHPCVLRVGLCAKVVTNHGVVSGQLIEEDGDLEEVPVLWVKHCKDVST
jgi:hypothetical protein